MTRIILENVRDRADLGRALSTVLQAMSRPDAFAYAVRVFGRAPGVSDAGAAWLRSLVAQLPFDPDLFNGMIRRDHPTPYAVCPRRGRHHRLTECWRCWSDVMRGQVLEVQVVTEKAWRTPPE